MELDWLKRWKLYSPNNVALKDGDTGRELSYKTLFEQAVRGAEFLKNEFGLQKGDRVAVLSTNQLEYFVLLYSLQRLGAILVPVNYRLTQREVDHIVSDCSPKLIVYESAYENIVLNLEFKCKSLLIKDSTTSDFHQEQSSLKCFAKEINKNTLISNEYFDATESDPCMIIYTSGTTGAPKGAIISHSMLFWNSINTSLRLNIFQYDCAVIFLPFFHTGGLNVLTTPFLHRGAKAVIIKKFDGDQILNLSEKEKATLIFGVPTTMDMMARSPLFEKVNLSAVRYAIVGGEPMPLPLIETWHKKGIPIRQGYGLTEFGPNVFSLNEEDAIRKIGSIGFQNFYTNVKIVDEAGAELGCNQVGELALKGPMCMSGYWQNAKATQETIREGWLFTGDLVRKDEEGYFYVVGRKKDMYKSGGENVYPPEVEQVLRKFPGILEVAVIGVPDEKWGEVGKAFIVPENKSLSVEEIQKYCLQNLAKFKIPKYFIFIESLPKGDSGKILKRKLTEL